MKFDRKNFCRVLILLSFLSLIAFAFRVYTYWKEIEIVTEFFSGSKMICTAYNVLGFFVFFVCLALSQKKGGILLSEKQEPKKKEVWTSDFMTEEPDEMIPQEKEEESENLPDFCKKSVLWQGTLSAFLTLLPGFGFLAFSLSFVATNTLSDPYQFIFAILSALSGAYFLFTGLVNSPKKIPSRPFFALVPALWCTVRMVVEYRDLTRFVNKTLYIGQFLFIISTMVFFLYQAQILVGDKPLNRPNAYAFSALPVVFFGFTARLPQLFAVLGDKITVDLIGASCLMIDLAITLYAMMKIKTLLKN